MKTLYTAVATASEEGRKGHARTSDGILDVDLAVPVELGGPGGGTNPEQLFAAGYAACFANAMVASARKMRREELMEDVKVTANVDLGTIGGGRWGLAVKLDVDVPNGAQEEAEELARMAHERCPYSNATRGNIDVELSVHGGR